MCRGGRRPDQGGKAAAGPSDPTNGSRRSEASNSKPRNVAPQGEAAAEAPNYFNSSFKKIRPAGP